ncbi:MAG: hypothetical protein KAR42_08710 [candidate division Zixibacteria bacterium]|nr:hypothetical protein [candidate division Zixibacteria bacterium]
MFFKVLLLLLLISILTIYSQTYSQDTPTQNLDANICDIGLLNLSISNVGTFGFSGYDAATKRYRGFVYPRNSNIILGSPINIWIGGIVGQDTLVSTGYGVPIGEFIPPAGEDGVFRCRSLLKIADCPQWGAVSEQDFIYTYTDTVTDPALVQENQYDNRLHKPLYVSVLQNSYAWSFDYADDFILLDFHITNIGQYPIKNMFIGILGSTWASGYGADSDYLVDGNHTFTGFLGSANLHDGNCMDMDTLNIAWHADNDGRPNEAGQWDYKSNRSIIGIKTLRPSQNEVTFNYNWWNTNQGSGGFGPRLKGNDENPFRYYGPMIAIPLTDEDRYYLMSHPEHDYDQMYTALNHTADGFLPPPGYDIATNLADGRNTKYLYSFGPFDIEPGDTIPVTIALVCGENFHVSPYDFSNYFDPFNPDEYYNRLDFSTLIENTRWAEAIFDNPGFDTDADGYAGEFCWIYDWQGDEIIDSTRQYYTGDGVPDFRAMSPPPPPVVRTYPEFGRVTLRWNGQESETTPDYFSKEIDFEGYNIYFAHDNRLTDFIKIASYDIHDYIVYVFDTDKRMWDRLTNSAKLDSLQNIHGSLFDPEEYFDEMHYFQDKISDMILYFKPQGWNQSQLGLPGTMRKVYPDASLDDPTDLTEEGWMRYYEYEFTVENLQASMPYYFAVTAFDYGAEKYDLGNLETSPLTNAVREYPLPSSETVEEQGLKVTVYPNPYRIDGGYANAGYENRDRTRAAAWSRQIHFANLPPICTIRIFSIDGDLIKEIKHYCPGGGPSSQEETWNVISRNTQAIVTGIYLWSVRSEMGEQIGKLVIMK